MRRISPNRVEAVVHRQEEVKRRERWLGHITQRVMCRLHIPGDASLVWLIGDGGERSNTEAVQTRIKDLFRTHSIDWHRADLKSVVHLVEQELRRRLEEVQNS